MLQILCMSLLDLRPWREGSYELGSVHPSLRPSSSFLRIGSLVSGAIWWCAWQTRNFSEKYPLVENYQIWSKMTLKPGWMKGTRFINGFLKKKKVINQKNQKNHQGFFLSIVHSERGQEVHENYINSFSNKILAQCKWATMDMKMADPNSGSTLSIVCKCCTMKRAKRYMKIILMVFKKTLFGATGPIWEGQIVSVDPRDSGSALTILWIRFFYFCLMKDLKRYIIILMVFFKKSCLLLFLLFIVCIFIDFYFMYTWGPSSFCTCFALWSKLT